MSLLIVFFGSLKLVFEILKVLCPPKLADQKVFPRESNAVEKESKSEVWVFDFRN